MRIRKKPWAQKEIRDNPIIIKNPQEYAGKWQDIFGNTNPIYVEIGMGKGKFIAENAFKHPEINYLGIEKQESVAAIAARSLKRGEKPPDNIRMFCGDGTLLPLMFKEKDISCIFINFCDPWQKKRWEKRRLTHKNFLRIYASLLTNDGCIKFKTDNKDLFEFSLNELLAENWQVKNISLDLHKYLKKFPDTENITTEYEAKFIAQGLPIYALLAARK